MANATIKLINPIQGHPVDGRDVQIAEVILREPKYQDVMTLGEPAAYAQSEGGLVYQAEKDEVVDSYIKRLLVEPRDPALLMQLGLADTLKLKEAVFGFFRGAREAISASS